MNPNRLCKIPNAIISVDSVSVDLVLALDFLLRLAARENVTTDDLVKELKQSHVWSGSSLDIIKEVWTEKVNIQNSHGFPCFSTMKKNTKM